MRINLLGAPGCGKSTLAAYFMARLKFDGVNADVSWEYVKKQVYAGVPRKLLPPQESIFDEQYYDWQLVRSACDVVITDSPLVLATHVYGDLDETHKTVAREQLEHPYALNILISPGTQYQQVGRYETQEEARAVYTKIRDVVVATNARFVEFTGDHAHDLNCAEIIYITLIRPLWEQYAKTH